MPQKTRKEKLAAQSRKRFQYTIVEPPQSRAQSSSPSTQQQSTPHVLTKHEYAMTQEDTLLKNFFISDLKKSLIYIGLILTLELFLYFVRINNYFS